MRQITISSNFKITIPLEIRQQMHLHVGQKLTIALKDGILRLLPDRPLATLRGKFKGMDVGGVREKVARLL